MEGNVIDVYAFKVKDFTTIMIGQKDVDKNGDPFYYVQRGEGTVYKYGSGIYSGLEWAVCIGSFDTSSFVSATSGDMVMEGE